MKTYPHGLVDSRKRQNCDFVWGTWAYQKEGDLPVVGRKRTWLQISARVAQQ